MTKTRLLILTDYYLPHWTGISKSINYLVKAINSKIDISILTVRLNKKDLQEEILDKAKIYREDYVFNISRAKFSFSILIKLIKIINNYNIVLINSPSIHILFFAVITKLFKKKLLIFHQGDLILPKRIINKIIEKKFDLLTFFSFKLANKVSTYTRDYAEHSRVLKPFLNKFSSLLIPITLDKKTKTVPVLANLEQNNKILLGFAGRFVEEKGFNTLLKAIPLVVKSIPNAYFVFAGKTNIGYEKTYEKNQALIKKNIKNLSLLGLLNQYELNYFYKNIDFIIVPSKTDCFNQVQAEAMLMGVPSIASNIPGLRYMIKHTGFGCLFESGNSKELAKAIIKAYKSKANLKKYINKPKELINNPKNYAQICKFIEK